MPEPIEQRVEGYKDLMEALFDKIKTDLEDYVRDIAVASWNSALSEATSKIEFFPLDEDIEDDVAPALDAVTHEISGLVIK